MYKVSDKVVFREIDDKIVLINLESGYYYSLNECGRFIFNLLIKNKQIHEVLEEINSRFEVSMETAKSDLEQFIGELEKEKILILNN
jgi:hypothetical protein